MKIKTEYIENCKDKELLKILRRLQTVEKYCLLVDGSLKTYVDIHDCIGDMPEQLKEWLKLFNGGRLFTTSMFSTLKKVDGKINSLLTFAGVNDLDFKKENDIPSEVMFFAMTNYGNYYCYISNEKSECVYEWDVEQNALIVKWDLFSDWLNEQIDFATSLINDALLNPVED